MKRLWRIQLTFRRHIRTELSAPKRTISVHSLIILLNHVGTQYYILTKRKICAIDVAIRILYYYNIHFITHTVLSIFVLSWPSATVKCKV